MLSEVDIRETTKNILLAYGVSDKDKLEAIPEAVAAMIAGLLVSISNDPGLLDSLLEDFRANG